MIDTDGHTTVLVPTALPNVSAERQKLIQTALLNPPAVWYSPPANTSGLNAKSLLVFGAIAVGLVLLFRRS